VERDEKVIWRAITYSLCNNGSESRHVLKHTCAWDVCARTFVLTDLYIKDVFVSVLRFSVADDLLLLSTDQQI